MVALDAAALSPPQRTCLQPEAVRTTRVVRTVRQGGATAVPEHRINSTRLHFLVTADWGGLPVWPWTTPGQRKVAAALGRVAQARRSAFILSLGDHFYFHGVRSVDDPRWQRTFDNVFTAPSLQGAGFWRIAAGNHDHDGNISAQLAYGARPGSRWRYPALQHAWREVLLPTKKKTPNEDSAEACASGGLAPAAPEADCPPEVVVGFVLIDTVMLCGASSSRPKPVARGTVKRFGGAERHWAWVEAALARMEDADYIVVGEERALLEGGRGWGSSNGMRSGGMGGMSVSFSHLASSLASPCLLPSPLSTVPPPVSPHSLFLTPSPLTPSQAAITRSSPPLPTVPATASARACCRS